MSGSTAGIGLAIATALAAEGAKVVVNGRTEARIDAALGPQTVFSGLERTWARFSPQIMRGIMRAVGAIMRSPNMDGRF